MTAKIVLQCESLRASYGRRLVLRSVNLALSSGVYSLQGANGIGKSTLLRLLAGAQIADAGNVWIDGINLTASPREAKRLLSYVPDESPIYPFMTGRELLQFVASIKHTSVDASVRMLIGELALSPHMDTRFDAMSLGTQKKLLLCAAAIGTPHVILMDEPGNGLDTTARNRLIRLLSEWGTGGVVIFSAHDADFVAATGATVIEMPQILGSEESVT